MSLESQLGHLFKPEIKNYGAQEFSKGTIFISNHSDTQIQASMKSMIPIRISLRAESISSSDFSANCNCQVYIKGNLCKHIWAVLLTVEIKHPDFLNSKTNIEMLTPVVKATVSKHKENQAEFKKQQYEKQKIWAKDLRVRKKNKLNEPSAKEYPANIQSALEFFSLNGYIINEVTDPEELNKAKKTLYRVFHPDKGGSHAEAVILNKHFDVLVEFLQTVQRK